MPKQRQTNAASARTRELLILAGERLFGEKGIDAVSLRQINTEAGQRNSSAAHYHFGSKEALIHAIFNYRMERVNKRRMQMVKELTQSGNKKDVRSIVETIVYPILEEINDTEGGSHYIRFYAQTIGHPQINISDLWDPEHSSGLNQVLALLRAALPDMPNALIAQRNGLMWEQTIHALADREKLDAIQPPEEHLSSAAFISNLMDTVAGGLTAPVSDATLAELRRGQGQATAG